MVTANKKLEVFEMFEVDYNLPKHRKLNEGDNEWNLISSDGTVFNTPLSLSTLQVNDSNIGFNERWIGALKSKAIRFINKIGINIKVKRRTVTIVGFFNSLGKNLQDLSVTTDISVYYEMAIKNAMNGGQVALVDNLKSKIELVRAETNLILLGLTKYLTEDQVIAFYMKAEKDRGLKLTWIKNFVRLIPTKIMDIKVKLDNDFVFDNYVILHYDPNNDGVDLTKREKEEIEKRKKDPILFGVIKNSRKLYYIGDWIDEHCNLTLDVVLKTLKDKANEINNNTVKTYIDRGLL